MAQYCGPQKVTIDQVPPTLKVTPVTVNTVGTIIISIY